MNQIGQQIDAEINEISQGLERQNQTKQARENNCRAVKGEGFEESAENKYVLAQATSEKNNMLLNALSYLCNDQMVHNDAPTLIAEIQTTLEENQILVPDQPNQDLERPITAGSGRSGDQ